LGRLKWESSDEFESKFGVKLSDRRDLERHRIIVEHRIMNMLKNNPSGLGIGRLAKGVGIDRKNLKLHLNRLIENGYVMKKDDVRGKYAATDKIFKNPILSSIFMAVSFSSDLLGKPKLILNDLKLDSSLQYSTTLLSYIQKAEYGLPRVIYEFAAQIGAFITYSLIQAMNPANKNIEEAQYLNKDEIIQASFRYSINTILPELMPKFKDSIRMELHSLDGDEKDPFGPFFDYGWSIPQFQLKKEVVDELILVFSSLFPVLYSELEKTRKKHPRVMQAVEFHTNHLQMQEQYQHTCKHRYVDDVSRLMESKRGNYWTKWRENGDMTTVHCVNCHHTCYRKDVSSFESKSYESLLR